MNLFLIIISILLSLLFLFIVISYFENEKLNVTYYTIDSHKLPTEFNGARIAVLADLHNHVFGVNNQPLIEAIDRVHPDYIMIVGDMVTRQKNFDGTTVYQLLEQLSSRYQIFYSNGNHEQSLSLNPDTKELFETFLQSIKALGVHHLSNESHLIDKDGAKLCVNGLQLDLEYFKKHANKTIPPNKFTRTISSDNPNCFQILLAHNPNFFPEYTSWGADLVLSGHVHGGMVVIPGIGGILSTQGIFFPNYDFGSYHEGTSTMILSRGLGGHTIKIRIFNRPELVMIELKKTLENGMNN